MKPDESAPSGESMTPDRYARLKELLLLAADLPAEDRNAFLDEACQDDAEMRRQVESVLAHDQTSDEIMKTGVLIRQVLGDLPMPDSRDSGGLAALEGAAGAAVGDCSGGDPARADLRRERPGGLDGPDLPADADALSGRGVSSGPGGERRGLYADLAGRTIGHHLILERLGEGGMGVVYKARDTRLDRVVALKVMRLESSADAHKRLRFLQEARAASRLNHPGIVTVYEVDSFAGGDYIAMEYVEGPTLRDRIPAGGMPVGRALRYWLQLAEALSVAHRVGIIHRDLKPSNVLIASGDRLKIADFGLAKISEISSDSTGTSLTGDGVVVGTPAYMSPEQAAGGTIDARSDLFSLGCILYEMLSGRQAFAGESRVAVITTVLRDAPPPLADVPPLVRALVQRCLQKKPDSRFQSAAEVIGAIETCLRISEPSDRGEYTSVAVLPFANMTAVQEDDYLCEGLSEEIINVLTTVPGLTVIARTSAFAVSKLGLDVCQIGARLGVHTVLEGSVRRSGEHMRVTAQLVETSKGADLWSERYDCQMLDIFALEDEIAGAISKRLRGDLARQAQVRPVRPPAPGAHEAYLEGRYHYARGSAEALQRADKCYQRALELDPDFALAHESVAALYFDIAFSGAVPPREAFGVATFHTAKAMELNESSAEAHALLATMRKELDYDWTQVNREFDRAMALNPASPVVRFRRALSGLMPIGRLDEAVAEMHEVLRADPLSAWMHYWTGIMHFLARQPDLAVAEGDRILELQPSHPLGFQARGVGLAIAGRYAEAIPELEKAYEQSGHMATPAGLLAWTYGAAGCTEQARAFLPPPGSTRYICPMVQAFVHAGLEEWDETLEWLDRAIDARDPHVVPIKSMLMLDPIREDPRFKKLLVKMKLA